MKPNKQFIDIDRFFGVW